MLLMSDTSSMYIVHLKYIIENINRAVYLIKALLSLGVCVSFDIYVFIIYFTYAGRSA